MNRIRRLLLGILSLASVFVLWWLVTDQLQLFSEALLPSPWTVAEAFEALLANGQLVRDTGTSLFRVIQGFGLALVITVPLAALMASSRLVNDLVEPLVEVARPIPPLAIIPLSILWFGIGEGSKLFIIAYGAFFPLLVNTYVGFRSMDPQLMRAVQSLGASRIQAFWHVSLHSAFEHLVVGMRLGMAMAFLVLVGAELIAADSGLGFLIQDSRNRFRSDQMLVGVITIGIVGYLLNALLLWLERRLLPWKAATNR